MDMKPDPRISPDQQSRIGRLSGSESKFIDSKLLKNCSGNWRKVARIVGTTMVDLTHEVQDIPDVYLANRVYEFVESGILEYQGNLGNIRYCEVRIASHD